jgi:serine/threonine protein phosphatase PrpC
MVRNQGSMPGLTIDWAGATDAGRRQRNEDAHVMMPEAGLFVIADGINRQPHGQLASRIAVETVRTCFREAGSPSLDDTPSLNAARFRAVCRLINDVLRSHERDGDPFRQMGTTFLGRNVLELVDVLVSRTRAVQPLR